MGRTPNIKIDGEKLKEAIDNNPLDAQDICTFVLKKSQSYLSKCISNNSISEENLTILCGYLKIPTSDILLDKDNTKEGSKPYTEDIVVNTSQILNREGEILAELKALKSQNVALITCIKNLTSVMEKTNATLEQNTEKVKAIFTEVKYNK